MTEPLTPTARSRPGDVRSHGSPDYLQYYIEQTFHHTFRGYSVAEVDAHLRQVRAWFTLAGFDRLLADRREEIFGSAQREAEATVANARREAETTIETARHEAAASLDQARREAQVILEQARREAQGILEQARREAQAVLDGAARRAEATTAAAEQRLASIKTLASAILDDVDAHS